MWKNMGKNEWKCIKWKSNISLHEHCTRIVQFIVCINNDTILWRWLECITNSRVCSHYAHWFPTWVYFHNKSSLPCTHIHLLFQFSHPTKTMKINALLEDKLILIFLRCYLCFSFFFLFFLLCCDFHYIV